MSGTTASPTQFLNPINPESSFSLDQLIKLINQVSEDAKQNLNAISQKASTVSIGDMFKMQMLMNHLSQMGEMASAVVSAVNNSMNSLTRGIKGG